MEEFLRRVKKAAEALPHELQCYLVEYYSESYSGPVGIFRKRSIFAHQSEFRIALVPGDGKPYTLRVGDLSDIVGRGDLDDLKHIHLRSRV
jgi:hypothetical protein